MTVNLVLRRQSIRRLLRLGLVLFIILFVAGPVFAHGGHGTVVYDELELRFRLPAGESGEVDFEMDQGEAIDWDVRTEDGRPVDVEIHSHGFETRRHEVQNGTAQANGSFEAPFGGYYGLLVEHATGGNDTKGSGDGTTEEGSGQQDVVVQLRIEGWFSVLGMTGIVPLEDEPVVTSPGPAAMLLVTAGLATAALVGKGRRR